jgi:hypothetical protein
MRHLTLALVLAGCSLGSAGATTPTGDLLLADGQSWPGRLLLRQGDQTRVLLTRSEPVDDQTVPRVRSVAVLDDGRIVFCSGLDRRLMELTESGERELIQGGYIARQLRTSHDGKLYWSGLETPPDGAPLPDGFLYSWDPRSGEQRTVLTFSQGDVGHDWWGAFDFLDERIIVGTLNYPTRLYDLSVSPPVLVATLPISAKAFRFAADGAVWACDGEGRLIRIPDLAHAETQEVVIDRAEPFVDFVWRNPATQ